MSLLASLMALSSRCWFEPEPDGLDAVVVGAERIRRQPHLHPGRDVLGIRLGVDDVGPHRSAVAVDDGSHERHRDARARRWATIVNVSTVPSVATGTAAEARFEARRAGVAAVEVAGPARRALVRHRGGAGRRARGTRRAGSVRSSPATVRGTGTRRRIEVVPSPPVTERASVPRRVRPRGPARRHRRSPCSAATPVDPS